MFLHCLVRELGGGQKTHALQGQVTQVRLSVLQELAKLVTRSHKQAGFSVEQSIQYMLVTCSHKEAGFSVKQKKQFVTPLHKEAGFSVEQNIHYMLVTRSHKEAGFSVLECKGFS